MDNNILGLKRGIVQLVPHNPQWTELFEKEKTLLKEAFGNTILATEHVGSTAIPGIPAKPILDIGIAVESLEVALAMKDQFEQLGYAHRPFVPGRPWHSVPDQVEELYVRGPESKRTHYVHVSVIGSDYWNRALLFRDFLRSNCKRAQEYADLKIRLATEFADDRNSYTTNKSEFILETLEMAKKALE